MWLILRSISLLGLLASCQPCVDQYPYDCAERAHAAADMMRATYHPVPPPPNIMPGYGYRQPETCQVVGNLVQCY